MRLLPARHALVAKRPPLSRVVVHPQGAVDETTKYPTERRQPPRDLAIAALAGRQHGVVSLAQLVNLGLSPEAVRSRVASGRLHRVHRGVYAVGHSILTDKGRVKAATLAFGARCAAS